VSVMWLATRSMGLMSMVLLSMVVVLGMVSAGGWGASRWPRMVTAGLHRSLSLLTVSFLVVHIATTVLDGYVPVGWSDVVIPFATTYQTVWLALGTIAVDLLICLVATSLLRPHVPARAWRAVHWFAYACWAAATVHALGVGTDKAATLGVAVAGIAAVTVAALVRALVPARRGESGGVTEPAGLTPTSQEARA
jgi:methionine sulfoxide reductase heme-binding subunit